jgi:predicted nucleic acid-binding protein
LSFDLQGAERRLKPQKESAELRQRSRGDLRWAADEPRTGGPILLDAKVYIDVLQGRTPSDVDNLLRFRSVFHSAVCLAELTHAFGRLDPENPRSAKALTAIAGLIEADIPRHRLFGPDVQAWGEAGMLAGKALRLAGLPSGKGLERKLLNDSLIYLQARRVGAAVLTRNRRDFDLLNQLDPSGAVIFYA